MKSFLLFPHLTVTLTEFWFLQTHLAWTPSKLPIGMLPAWVTMFSAHNAFKSTE